MKNVKNDFLIRCYKKNPQFSVCAPKRVISSNKSDSSSADTCIPYLSDYDILGFIANFVMPRWGTSNLEDTK